MSILIRGMEMPPRCGRCDMRISAYDDGMFDHYECCITAAIIDNLGEKMEDCPLVPVPPHGRLIDADALASEMEKQISYQDELMELCKSAGDTKNYFNTSKVQIGMVSFLRALNDSPTIIPADGGET